MTKEEQAEKYVKSLPITDSLLISFAKNDFLHGGQFGIEPGYCVMSIEPDNNL